MKKIVSCLLFIGSLACAQAATTMYDITTANADKTGAGSMSSNTGNAYVRGFKFSLDSDWFFPTADGGATHASLPSQVILNSLSITLRTTDMVNLIILSGDATQAGQSQVVGFSSGKTNSGGIGTWSFGNDLVLDTSTSYTFVFTSISDASQWTSSSTIGNASANQGIKVGSMGTSMPGAYPSGEGIFNNYSNLITNMGSTIKLSVSVPEPSTAALGLLGLGVLILHRRRNA